MAYCSLHNRSFGSQSALDQHMSSPVHAPGFLCEDCDRSFGSQSALDQHMNSPAHTPLIRPISVSLSPLDMFFNSFPGFPYTPTNPPQQEYSRLRQFYSWGRNDPDGETAWSQYRSALVREFNRWYGEEDDDMKSWRSICRAIGIFPIPQTPKDCRSVSVTHKYSLKPTV